MYAHYYSISIQLDKDSSGTDSIAPKVSHSDAYSLNQDPDPNPGFWLNPDPGFCCIKKYTKNCRWKKFSFLINKCNIFLLRPQWWVSMLHEKASSSPLRMSSSWYHKMFSYFVGPVCLSGSGSINLIESGSEILSK